MIESTQELAENKLILLYVFNKLKLKLTDEQITSIILENNLINYFLLKQYISELVDSGFLKIISEVNTNFYTITQKGILILDLFQNRIPKNTLQIVDDYIQKNFKQLQKETEISSTYTPKSTNEFIVNCKILENSALLLEVNLNVATKNQAISICENWQKNAQKICSDIIISLTEKHQE